jgi:hypothetical protein
VICKATAGGAAVQMQGSPVLCADALPSGLGSSVVLVTVCMQWGVWPYSGLWCMGKGSGVWGRGGGGRHIGLDNQSRSGLVAT